jgi:hypothetical protein
MVCGAVVGEAERIKTTMTIIKTTIWILLLLILLMRALGAQKTLGS